MLYQRMKMLFAVLDTVTCAGEEEFRQPYWKIRAHTGTHCSMSMPFTPDKFFFDS